MKKSFFKFLFFIFISFYFFNISSALSLLPKNAYLKIGDNQKEVFILQQILNSNPDTLIADSGVGSPGKETWLFGTLTKNALEKFQEKYSLEITGQIDSKTLKKINEYVTAKNTPVKKVPTTKVQTTNKKPIAEEENIYLKTDETKTQKTTTPTYLDTMIDKYTGGLSPITPLPTISDPNLSGQTTYSAANPYYNPQTRQYQSSPVSSYGSASPYSTSPTSQGYSGMNAPGYYSQNLPFGNTGGGLSPYGGYISPGDVNNAGQITGNRGDIGECEATSFAHATFAEGCAADRADQQNNQEPASFKTFHVYLSRTGVKAVPAIALPRGGSYGDAIEVKDMSTGKCKAFPLLDRGPAPRIVAAGKCIDMTGSAIDILKGTTPCGTVASKDGKQGKIGIKKVQYAIIPGEKIKPGEVKDCKHLK